jgi:hypothetical protein
LQGPLCKGHRPAPVLIHSSNMNPCPFSFRPCIGLSAGRRVLCYPAVEHAGELCALRARLASSPALCRRLRNRSSALLPHAAHTCLYVPSISSAATATCCLAANAWSPTPPCPPPHQVTISTCGSSYDTKLILATSLADLNTYLCNDDDRSCAHSTSSSRIDAALKAGAPPWHGGVRQVSSVPSARNRPATLGPTAYWGQPRTSSLTVPSTPLPHASTLLQVNVPPAD